MSGTTQTLKSSLQSRVNLTNTERLGSQARNLGEGALCGAMANLYNDVYGRPVSQNTLRLLDSSCSNYTEFPALRLITIENSERPVQNLCRNGNCGGGDFMGVGRDRTQQNLYGYGYEGNFIRTYPTPNNAPWDPKPAVPNYPYYQYQIQPTTFSMDGTAQTVRL
jgi:hypothetical protein